MKNDYSVPVIIAVLVWFAQATYVGVWSFRALKATVR